MALSLLGGRLAGRVIEPIFDLIEMRLTMKIKHQLLLFMGISILLLATCVRKVNGPQQQAGSIHFYFLQDTTVTTSDVFHTDIENLQMESVPWLTQQNLEMVDFSTHLFYLKSNKNDLFEFDHDLPIHGKPFVVCANNQRCYLASIHHPASSLAPQTPYISMFFDKIDILQPPKCLLLEGSWMDVTDTRNHPTVKQTLIDLGLFHAGLSVELKDIRLLENADISTIRFTFKLINKDEDNLYVLDPGKMGHQFFYFTNGINMWQGEKYQTSYYYSEFKDDPTPTQNWSSEWYVLLESGSSMIRTVTLRGYPRLPTGNYSCSFQYACPTPVPDDVFRTTDDRYWLGHIFSETFQWTLN